MDLSSLFFSVKRGDLSVGYGVIQLEWHVLSLCYWKIHEGTTCDIWVMVLLFKLCWGRKCL